MHRNDLLVPLPLALLLVAASAAGKADGQKTVLVDCTKGQSIQAALKDKAEELIVEIRGICDEDVVVTRSHVTLRGADPAFDGLRGVGGLGVPAYSVVRVEGVRDVRLESLRVEGGLASGVGLRGSGPVEIENCRIVDNLRDGVAVNASSFATVTDTELAGNGRSGVAGFAGDLLICRRCAISGSPQGALVINGTRVSLEDSTVSATFGVLAAEGAPIVWVRDTTVTGDVLSLWATEDADIFVTGGELEGSIVAEQKSMLVLDGAEQTAQTVGQNLLDLGTIARLTGGATLLGPVSVEAFSNLAIQGGSIAGDLTCSAGADAFCTDPAAVSGVVNGCGRCVKP